MTDAEKLIVLREYVESDAICPCCEEMTECVFDCTFAGDNPFDSDRQAWARAVLEQTA